MIRFDRRKRPTGHRTPQNDHREKKEVGMASAEWKSRFLLGMLLTLAWIPVLPAGSAAQADEPYFSCPGVIHIHTTFSSGVDSLSSLAEEGRKHGLGYLITTDHDLVVMEYGMPPLRNIIKKREELPSIIQGGAQVFKKPGKQSANKDLVLIPGAQSSPYYYWTGNIFQKSLTAHDYRKEILLIGMSDPEFFDNLPVLHNAPVFSLSLSRVPDLLLPLAGVLLSLTVILLTPRLTAGWVLFAVSLLLLLNSRPFSPSRFTPYDGRQGNAPFQELIDYADSKGVLTFWAHPESKFDKDGERYGPIILKTESSVRNLLATDRYTGFSALYGDVSTIHRPGGEWDQVLDRYCTGKRQRPVWAIAEGDFHGARQSDPLDTFLTIAWVKSATREGILDAIAKGRCYGIHQEKGKGLRLESFEVKAPSGKSAWSGETLTTREDPVVTAQITMSDAGSIPVKVTIVRGGAVWKEIEGITPLPISIPDTLGEVEKTYYRLEVQAAPSFILLSNPIFVQHDRTPS